MKSNFINWRLVFICSFLVASIFAIFYKIISVQIAESVFLQNEGKKRYIKYRNINPVRGSIYDRNNFPLAISIINYDLYALKGLNNDQYLKLKDNIAIDEEISIKKLFTKKILLKKNINVEEQKIIDGLNLDKVEVEVRHSRHYPLGEQISTLIGFYGKDRAQEGLEKSYDSMLSGQSGRQKYFVNAKQRIISKPIDVSKTIPGRDIVLTIDSTIQFYAYKYLAETIAKNKAKAGTVLVFDNKKGEILAIASYPSYNPNDPMRSIQKNRALIDAYELGSVLKPIVFSRAVDQEIIDPDEYMEIPRRLQLENKMIIDTKNHEKLTPKEIIAHSSQVGATKIALKLGYEDLINNPESIMKSLYKAIGEELEEVNLTDVIGSNGKKFIPQTSENNHGEKIDGYIPGKEFTGLYDSKIGRYKKECSEETYELFRSKLIKFSFYERYFK